MSGQSVGYVLGFLFMIGLIWLFIGSINYLFVYRRMGYLRAITRPWVLGVGTLVFALALFGQIAQRI